MYDNKLLHQLGKCVDLVTCKLRAFDNIILVNVYGYRNGTHLNSDRILNPKFDNKTTESSWDIIKYGRIDCD